MYPIVYIRIYYDPINGPDGCIPMADIQFLDGTVNTIQWNSDTRNLYLEYITSHTFIYDDRQKPDVSMVFEKFNYSRMELVRSHINMDGINSEQDYYIDKMNMYIKHGYAYFHTYNTDYNYVGIYPAYCFEDTEDNLDNE